MKPIVARAYNSFRFDTKKSSIIKKSPSERFLDEVAYYQKLPADLQVFFPRLLSIGVDGAPFAEFEMYAYNDLGSTIVLNEFDFTFWERVADQIIDVTNQIHDHKNDYVSLAALQSMYEHKTINEYQKLVETHLFSQISKYPILNINGEMYDNFEIIWPKVLLLIQKMLFGKVESTVIHGDLCFANILASLSDKTNAAIVKLVDPRGSFHEKGIYGDPRYDFAKLRHSYYGKYEFFIQDKFSLDCNKNSFSMEFNNTSYITRIFEQKIPSRLDYKLIEGLIFIGMCARHYDSERRQIGMYLTGIKTLNEVLREAS